MDITTLFRLSNVSMSQPLRALVLHNFYVGHAVRNDVTPLSAP